MPNQARDADGLLLDPDDRGLWTQCQGCGAGWAGDFGEEARGSCGEITETANSARLKGPHKRAFFVARLRLVWVSCLGGMVLTRLSCSGIPPLGSWVDARRWRTPCGQSVNVASERGDNPGTTIRAIMRSCERGSRMMPPASTTSNGFAGQTGLYARVVKPQAIGGWAMDVSGVPTASSRSR